MKPTDEVLPCPFCGHPPFVAEEMDPDDWWYVTCQTPGCILPIAAGHTSIESAIARWNRRAAPIAPAAVAPKKGTLILGDGICLEGQPDGSMKVFNRSTVAQPDDRAALPIMRAAFRVTETEGNPDPDKQRFHMRFTFRSMDELHAADDEWRAFSNSARKPYERSAFDVALDALADYQRNWDTGLPAPYVASERIAMECAVEAVREALNEARAALQATVKGGERIERLRKALFEARDAMRVMSGWVKKSDPAGHSWAVSMVDRANDVLSHAPEIRAAAPQAGALTDERIVALADQHFSWGKVCYVDADRRTIVGFARALLAAQGGNQ